MRRKLFVAYRKGEVVGMSNGLSDAEARRLFARERRIPAADIVVKWTGLKEVSIEEYRDACEKQAAFFA